MTSEETPQQIEIKGEDITPDKDGGVLKEILKEGHGDEMPLANDKVSVHYVGTLLDGTKFDSSRDRNDKFQFDLGKGSVIKAWDIGVATMKRGEICRLICQPAYAYGEKGSGDKIKPNATLVFEIELFDFVGEDISEDKDHSIVRRVIKKGEGWMKPNDGASVEVILKGTHDGRVFDDRTVSFTVGEGFLKNIPEGIEYAVTKMPKGEHCKLKLKSKATTGVEKFGVAPHSTVDYEVTMVNFEKAKDSWSLSDAEKLEQSEVLKKRAGELIKDGHYRVALKKYKTISDYLESPTYESDADKEKAKQLKLASQSNSALCHLKMGNHAECIKACDKALEIEAQNEKCLFRRAQSQMAMSNFEEAIKDFQAVLKLNASNAAAKQHIVECREKIKEHHAEEKQLYAKIFAKLAKESEKNDTTKTEVKPPQNETKTADAEKMDVEVKQQNGDATPTSST